jgi:predicted  nucleic acid-binding Zn-ribbon protein
MMEIQQTLLHIGMDLNGTKDEFRAELVGPQPHLETLEQLIENFRETLDVLDNQAQMLRLALQRMEEKLDAIEPAET